METNSTLILQTRKPSLKEVKCPIRLLSPEKKKKVILGQNLHPWPWLNRYFHISSAGRNFLIFLGKRLPSLLQVFLDGAGSLHYNNLTYTQVKGCCEVLPEVLFLLLIWLYKAKIKH